MTWRLFRRSDGGSFQLVGVDDELLVAAPIVELVVACELVIDAPSVLPEDVGDTEREIERITTLLHGRIAGTIRSATRLWVLAYVPDGAGIDRYRSVPPPSSGTIRVDVRVDPGWGNFDRVRPEGMEDQSLADVRMLDDLFGAGDAGGARPIEHSVRDVPLDRVDALAASLSSVGYSVERRADADVASEVASDTVSTSIMVRHRADPADITPDSWTIRQIAERFGATYSGWTCSVVERTAPPRRRWFRRSRT